MVNHGYAHRVSSYIPTENTYTLSFVKYLAVVCAISDEINRTSKAYKNRGTKQSRGSNEDPNNIPNVPRTVEMTTKFERSLFFPSTLIPDPTDTHYFLSCRIFPLKSQVYLIDYSSTICS